LQSTHTYVHRERIIKRKRGRGGGRRKGYIPAGAAGGGHHVSATVFAERLYAVRLELKY